LRLGRKKQERTKQRRRECVVVRDQALLLVAIHGPGSYHGCGEDASADRTVESAA